MLNLNKSWVQKQGDFFVESPIVLFTAIIWFLKIYEGGRFCTFPHAIELLNKRYEDVFTILTSYPELENYLSPFIDAWKGGASEQLQGQIASAKIPLSRLISPQLYWVMSGSDFTLDINNPKEPKVLCVGNNPDRISIYGAALGLYNSRIVKLINKKKQIKSCVIIDELPTIFFKGLDNLIATARSNSHDTSTSINTQLDSLIPASKISTLSQGIFVGAVADNFGEIIEQKIFHAQIVVDNEAVQKETAAYQPIPEISSFLDAEGNDTMEQQIQANYRQIKQDIVELVENELIRIENDPELKHLLGNNEGKQV